jgi:hypothetical protein
MIATNRSSKRATKKQTKRRTKKRQIKRQIFLYFSENHFRSGGEENERQMENNVMQEMRVYGGYLVRLM